MYLCTSKCGLPTWSPSRNKRSLLTSATIWSGVCFQPDPFPSITVSYSYPIVLNLLLLNNSLTFSLVLIVFCWTRCSHLGGRLDEAAPAVSRTDLLAPRWRKWDLSVTEYKAADFKSTYLRNWTPKHSPSSRCRSRHAFGERQAIIEPSQDSHREFG